MNDKTIEKYVFIVVIIVVLFQIVANTLPVLQTAGQGINNAATFANSSSSSYIPLASLFGSTGVLWIVLLAVIFLAVIRGLMKNKK